MANPTGKPKTQDELDIMLEKIRPHLEGGISLHKACLIEGVDRNLLQRHAKTNTVVEAKLQLYQSYLTRTLSYITSSILGDMKKAIDDAIAVKAPVRKLFDKDELQFVRTVAMYNRSVRTEWGNDVLPEGDSPEQPSFTAPRNEVEAELQIMVLNKHADYVRAKQRNTPVDTADSAET